MSLWAKFKNYFFGVPLPKSADPVAEPVKEVAPKQIDLKINETSEEATITVAPAPAVEVKQAEPEKKKPQTKKRTSKKKSN